MRRYGRAGSEFDPALGQIIPQALYQLGCDETRKLNADVMKLFSSEEATQLRMLKGRLPVLKQDLYGQMHDPYGETRRRYAKTLLKARNEMIAKADPGLTTATGYNFYDLRGPAYLLYPINTPFRNSLPRIGRVNDGYGTAARWQATRNFGSNYAGVLEGQRAAIASPDDNPYIASYKELGIERGATFTSQFAGEGYTDNVADEHLRGMHELWLQEEGIMLLGNSGIAAGNNGFALGVTPTPVAAGVDAGGTLAAGFYTVYCVAITALGQPNNLQYGYNAPATLANGLVPVSVRTNADGSQTQVNGGTGIVSLASNTVHITGTGILSASLVPKNGSFWYAWFVDVEASNITNKANAVLAAITSVPEVSLPSNAGWGTQSAAAAGLGTDYSFQPTDFDGLLTYAAAEGMWINQGGATFTPLNNGRVAEIEEDLYSFWNLYQAQPDEIWCSADAKRSLSDAIMSTATGTLPVRFNYTRDSQNQIIGGFNVNAYQSEFSMSADGGESLPMKIHPMLPPGTIYYHLKTNPYPGSRAPFVAGMLVQREYYSIEWPLVTRQWTFGTYVHEVLAHTLPWITAVRTGIGPS
jgi:hypothetical protein